MPLYVHAASAELNFNIQDSAQYMSPQKAPLVFKWQRTNTSITQQIPSCQSVDIFFFSKSELCSIKQNVMFLLFRSVCNVVSLNTSGDFWWKTMFRCLIWERSTSCHVCTLWRFRIFWIWPHFRYRFAERNERFRCFRCLFRMSWRGWFKGHAFLAIFSNCRIFWTVSQRSLRCCVYRLVDRCCFSNFRWSRVPRLYRLFGRGIFVCFKYYRRSLRVRRTDSRGIRLRTLNCNCPWCLRTLYALRLGADLSWRLGQRHRNWC